MSSVWERFEGIASAEEVVQAASSRTPLDEGIYRMILKKLEPAETQTGLPKLAGEFILVDGGRKVYYNQILQNLNYPNMTAKNIANAVAFIGGLLGQKIEFESMGDLEGLVYEVPLETEHTIKVSYRDSDNERKYPQLEVVLESQFEDMTPIDNGDLPF